MDYAYLAEVCLKAADIIATRGLVKGQLYDETGAVCNNGAILIALGVPEEHFGINDLERHYPELEALSAIGVVERLILENTDAGIITPWEYNDLDSTSAEDVILLLKRTAEKIRGMSIVFSVIPGGTIKLSFSIA